MWRSRCGLVLLMAPVLSLFEEQISAFRAVWVSGRFGGGKTSAAIHLACRLCAAGRADRIVSNTPLRLPVLAACEYDQIHRGFDYPVLQRSILVLDEAHRYVGAGDERRVKEWLAYLRKLDQVLICASVLPLARQLRHFVVERSFNGLVFGAPLWGYRWFMFSRTGDIRGWWWWWFPTKIFDLYDHTLPESDQFTVYDARGLQ